MSNPGDYSQTAPHGSPPRPPQKLGIPMWIIVPVAIVGFVVMFLVLAVLGIFGLRKYIANAKTAEARNAVTQLARDAAGAYEEDARRLCPSASQTVPERLEKVTGRRYQSAPAEWDIDKATKSGFSCLKYSMASPQYYLYGYRAEGASAAGDGFEATAHGDIDADGATSDFKLTGQIGASGSIELAPRIIETNPFE